MSAPRKEHHEPTLREAGLSSGSTRAKHIRGAYEDRGEATLEDIEQVERVVPSRTDREAGTPDAYEETD